MIFKFICIHILSSFFFNLSFSLFSLIVHLVKKIVRVFFISKKSLKRRKASGIFGSDLSKSHRSWSRSGSENLIFIVIFV